LDLAFGAVLACSEAWFAVAASQFHLFFFIYLKIFFLREVDFFLDLLLTLSCGLSKEPAVA